MHTEGNEVHETTDEARAGSTPNIVRWVLAISLLGAIVLLSIIWITGAATQSDSEEHVSVEARSQDLAEEQAAGDDTDSIVSDRPELIAGPETTPSPDMPAADVPEASPTPE